MSSEFVAVEVDKIVNDKSLEFPKNMALAATWILGNLKGINLKIMDVSHTSSLSDFYIIASATNTTQASSMANEILRHLKRHELNFLSKEGMNGSDWILLDGGDIIVHIFLESARDVYALEEIWTEAKTVEIPQSYYFSSEDAQASQKTSDDKDFF